MVLAAMRGQANGCVVGAVVQWLDVMFPPLGGPSLSGFVCVLPCTIGSVQFLMLLSIILSAGEARTFTGRSRDLLSV